ncbi:hypothetical protein VTJ83DRAFT_1526 [Remersonia thermophila]|uniref:Uncharacterized protein n=1 Tax=Remersonia thermophila TaxID=72144 RepID=A0ABR4DIF3_9PEZI
MLVNLPNDWNDKISSIHVLEKHGCRFFRDGGCSGSELVAYNHIRGTVLRLDDLTKASSASLANWNDQISSFRCTNW